MYEDIGCGDYCSPVTAVLCTREHDHENECEHKHECEYEHASERELYGHSRLPYFWVTMHSGVLVP